MNISLLIAILEQHGVNIDDRVECEVALAHYGLSRLLLYVRLMDNPSFSDVMELYNFDRDMRIQVGLLMEMLEIDIKTKMVEETTDIERRANNLSGQYINNTTNMDQILSNIIQKHREKLTSPTNPDPARTTTDFWKIMRVCSFGEMGLIFSELNNPKKTAIVNHYHLPMQRSVNTFNSWLSALRKVRNMRAHHEICIDNPSYLRISPSAGVRGSASFFTQLEVILFLCMQIDRTRTSEIRDNIATLLVRWNRDLDCNILTIVGAPADRQTVFQSI